MHDMNYRSPPIEGQDDRKITGVHQVPKAWSANNGLLKSKNIPGVSQQVRSPCVDQSSTSACRSEDQNTVSNMAVKVTESKCRGLVVAVIYGVCSTSMAFINKILMNTYGFTHQFTLMFFQMLFTIFVLELLRFTKVVSLPRYSLQRGRSFLMPSIIYATHSVLALHALSGMNIPMYSVVKRCGPLVTLILGTVILGKGWPHSRIIVAVALITAGCLIAGFGDLAFDLKAYTFGGISVFTQALYLVLLQQFTQSNATASETLHLNSYNTAPFLLFFSVLSAEMPLAVRAFTHPTAGFLISFSLTIIIGTSLNYLLFLCTTLNSALTTSIVGTLKSIVQTAIGMFTFGGISINVLTVSGISVNLLGGVLYTFTKYNQARSGKGLPFINGNIKKSRSANSLTAYGS